MWYVQARPEAEPDCRNAALSMSNFSRCHVLRLPRVLRLHLALCLLSAVLLGWGAAPARAQPPTGNLTALVNSGLYAYNGLEIAAAKANDAAYGILLADNCGTVPPGSGAPPPATCSAPGQLQLFQRLRELEDTADGLLGRGETTYSLRLGAQALGFALRWTADEEYSAQGSLTNKFANSQLTTLAGRFSALRFATQIRIARGDAPMRMRTVRN